MLLYAITGRRESMEASGRRREVMLPLPVLILRWENTCS